MNSINLFNIDFIILEEVSNKIPRAYQTNISFFVMFWKLALERIEFLGVSKICHFQEAQNL